jgi:hypothetical protein
MEVRGRVETESLGNCKAGYENMCRSIFLVRIMARLVILNIRALVSLVWGRM